MRTTICHCDRCGNEVESSQLRKIGLTVEIQHGIGSLQKYQHEIMTWDWCELCRKDVGLDDYYPKTQTPKLNVTIEDLIRQYVQEMVDTRIEETR